MMSLFSNFDLIFFSFSFFLYLLMFNSLLISLKYNSFYFISLKSFMIFMMNFFSSIKPKSYPKVMLFFLFTLFIMNIILNFSSVLCFFFPWNSQISNVLLFSLSIWISFYLFQFFMNPKGGIYHLIPEGTPIFLTWFLCFIEIISNFIRPLTLTVRLVANILAGHLLMALLSEACWSLKIMLITYLMLNVAEMMVALIQSYIFSTMLCLYFSEQV